MWRSNIKTLWVAGMGLVFCSSCAQFTGGPRPMSDDQRVLFETGYGAHETRKPELPPEAPDLSYFDDRDMAADALGRIGAPSIPELRLALKSPDPQVRKYAALALARAGEAAAPAVADLAELLSDADPDVRRMAARALGQIGPAAKDAVPALIRAIGDGKGAPAPVKSEPRKEEIDTELRNEGARVVRRSESNLG